MLVFNFSGFHIFNALCYFLTRSVGDHSRTFSSLHFLALFLKIMWLNLNLIVGILPVDKWQDFKDSKLQSFQ